MLQWRDISRPGVRLASFEGPRGCPDGFGTGFGLRERNRGDASVSSQRVVMTTGRVVVVGSLRGGAEGEGTVGESTRVLSRKPVQAPVAPPWLLIATCLLGMVAAALVAEAAFTPLWSAFVAAGAVGIAVVVALRVAHRATPVAAVAGSSGGAPAGVFRPPRCGG